MDNLSIRLLCDLAPASAPPPAPPIDHATNMPPAAWRGEALDIHAGVFADYASGAAADVSGWDSINLEIHADGTRRLPPLAAAAAAPGQDGMDKEAWDAASAATASFSLGAAAMDIDTLGSAARELWLVLYAVEGGASRTLLAGPMALHEPGRPPHPPP